MKIALAIVLSKYISKIRKIEWKEFFMIGIILGIPFVLIALQPDMGTASVFASLFLTAVLLKGIKKSIIVFLIITITFSSFLLWNYFLKPYQKDRITSFLNPEKYSRSSGYQIIQSKIAIGAGGINGKGYLKGSQSKYKFLPTRHTDFIISLLGEEFGFLGISFFLLLYFIFFYRQFSFITESEEELNLAYLLLGAVFFQFLINVLMSIGLIPILGLPLPFVSYGGSSMLGFYILEGIIFKIRINSYLNEF
jgi:rod shape determining protein RodA